MADASVPSGPHAAQYVAPAAVPASEKEQYIQQTPVWVVVLRGVQVFFSFVIVVMAGVLIHGKALDANGYAVACVSATSSSASESPIGSATHRLPRPARVGYSLLCKASF